MAGIFHYRTCEGIRVGNNQVYAGIFLMERILDPYQRTRVRFPALADCPNSTGSRDSTKPWLSIHNSRYFESTTSVPRGGVCGSFSCQTEDDAPDVDAQQAITERGSASLAILRSGLKLATVLRRRSPLAASGRFAPVMAACGQQRLFLIARHAGVFYSRAGIKMIMVVAPVWLLLDDFSSP